MSTTSISNNTTKYSITDQKIQFVVPSAPRESKLYWIPSDLLAKLQIIIKKPETLEKIACHVGPTDTALAVIELHKAHLLTPKNLELILNTTSCYEAVQAMIALEKEHLFTEKNFAYASSRSRQGEEGSTALILLHQNGLEKYMDVVFNSIQMVEVAQGIVKLNEAGLAKPQYVEHMRFCAPVDRAVEAMICLNQAALLTKENLKELFSHSKKMDVCAQINKLHAENNLNAATFKQILYRE